MPTSQEICTKQLYKVMDEIVKVDVNEDEIAPSWKRSTATLSM